MPRSHLALTRQQDIVVAFASPMGTDTKHVHNGLATALTAQGYKVRSIKLIEWLDCHRGKRLPTPKHTFEWYKKAQELGNVFCRSHDARDALARLGIHAIADLRKVESSVHKSKRRPNAFLITSLKRPEEVETLRELYGRCFLLVGVHDTYDARVEHLAERLATAKHRKRCSEDIKRATDLIVTDASEPGDDYGQRISATFPMADAFIDASVPATAVANAERLVRLIFTPSFDTPSKDEHAMVHAHVAGLRSSDLGRQVGAALASANGEILATGTNDVPRAGGGIYWTGDPLDARDFQLRHNVSKERRVRTARELIYLLKKSGAIPGNVELSDKRLEQVLKGTQLSSIGEFGRTVHAEMDAILNAARQGVPVAGTHMYTTTYPCHNCVRHMIAAGVARVVFVQPFDKSLASELHADAISNEGRAANSP